ncbi:MAG: methyltransferase family protein [Acidimicrobiales bacterium]|nr:methyltransferase family protein [Acidimicrobiales bacterium]
MAPDAPYYRDDLALVHHLGFGFHADLCAPGILALLEPVRQRDGVVLELGCGSGLLTRYLVDAGHRVIATDASPAMLDLTRRNVPEAEEIRRLVLPDDPLPKADAVVSIGHVLSYLDDESSIDRALAAAAQALHPLGVLAVDVCDLRWGEARPADGAVSWVTDEWVLVTRTSLPTPTKYVREMTTFVRTGDGAWRRDDERHDNVLIDTSGVPKLLKEQGLEADVRPAFGDESLPEGLVAIVGHRPG